jgi:hypothetical protein
VKKGQGAGKKPKGEPSSKIRSAPTRPLHAVLDERQSIGIAIRIIVLNHEDLLCFGAVSCPKTADLNEKNTLPRAENRK